MNVIKCKRCGLRLTDEHEPLDQQATESCAQHPARAEGWRGSTPHDWEHTVVESP